MPLTAAKEILSILLYVLGGVPINTNKDLHQQARLHSLAGEQRVRDRIGPGMWGVPLAPEMRLRSYIYRFEGRTLVKGQPMEGVKVTLEVTTSRISEVREAITAQDGSYVITFRFDGTQDEPVDWQMHAFIPDGKKVELVGRKIAMRESDTVTVQNNLDLELPYI